MDELLMVFAQEARERLDEMESGLMALELGQGDDETLHAIFRAAHTIKGSSGAADVGAIEAFTHVVENLLDLMRDGQLAATGEIISELLLACDHLRNLLDCLPGLLDEQPPSLVEAGRAIGARLQVFVSGDAAAVPAVAKAAETSVESSGPLSLTECWHVSVRFGTGVLRQGMDPEAFLRFLGSIGTIRHLVTLLDTMPEADEMDPEACYLGFEIDLEGAADRASIESVFDFVRDECQLHILPPRSRIADYLQLIAQLPEENMRLGEILVRAGALSEQELLAGLACQGSLETDDGEASTPRLGEILVDQGAVQAELVEAAAARQTQVSEKQHQESRLIRVQADKLDRLIDLVGELVIAGASAQLLARQAGETTLLEANAIVSRLVEDVRDSALQLRMVTIGETFNRFHRVVRDAALESGKTIQLDIRGADTELDKSVVERLADPLLHLVRNAIDHGIEPEASRVAAGKPAAGKLSLNAFHDSGSVVIEVRDDGGGLNVERIRAKAIERELISAQQTLSTAEIHNLIFEPGFSTAGQITNLSGRGVGMDVVKKNITALRGSVDVDSQPGEGSLFTLRLPLTLAIIDGFLVAAGRFNYVVPLDNVVECLELRGDEIFGDVLQLRGEALPVVRLRPLFGITEPAPRRENIVVVQANGHRAGIAVDALLGEFQTVIKPLGQLFRHLKGISGSTILGSGEVALIIDVGSLVLQAAQRQQAAHGARLPSSPTVS